MIWKLLAIHIIRVIRHFISDMSQYGAGAKIRNISTIYDGVGETIRKILVSIMLAVGIIQN